MWATTHLRAPFPRSRRAFGTKPLTPDDFDKSHPLLDGCVGAFYFLGGGGEPVNLIDNIRATIQGTAITWAPGDRGGGIDFSGDNSTDRIDLGSQPQGAPFNLGNENECTVITRFRFDAFGTTFPRIIDKSSGGSGQNGWALALRNAAPDRYVFYVASGSTEVNGTNFTAGDVRSIGVSVKGGSTARFFENGAFLASAAVANNFPTTTTDAAIGNWNTGTDRQIQGQMDYILVFNRALPDDHVVALMRDPYAPFERPIVFPLAPVTGSITADGTAGTLTLAGQAADQVVTTNIDASATAGTLTLTGQAGDVVITVGTGIQAEGTPGTITLAGQAADAVVTTNLDLQASAGAITLTGLAADFQTGVFIDADATPGAIALDGQAATVDITTALLLEATPGAIVLSGQQADVLGLVAPSIARPAVGGIKSRYPRRKTVIIGKKRYQVVSKEEEAMLVARYIEQLKAEREALQTEPAEQKKVTRRLKLATTRLRKLDVDPTAHLRAIDDELLTMLGGVPWL